MNIGKALHETIRENPILHNRWVMVAAGYAWNQLKLSFASRGLQIGGYTILDRPGPRLAFYKYLRGEKLNATDLGGLIEGKDVMVQTIHGPLPYLDLDYTATKPILRPVLDLLVRMYQYRHNIHRGPSIKSRISTAMFEKAREIVGQYFGYDPKSDVVAFTPNTTYATNVVARALHLEKDDVVLIAVDNHHSGMLPFRVRFPNQFKYIPIDNATGKTDLHALRRLCAEYGTRIKLVVDVHVSNVTGAINDIYEEARIAHSVGAKILVDAAQSSVSIPIEMHPWDPGEKIDFVAIGGHKAWGGDGSGAIIGPREFFRGSPPVAGGGVVAAVAHQAIYWGDPPHNLEPGTQNITAAIALAQSLILLQEADLREIRRREQEITKYALQELRKIPFITILGQSDFERSPRMGVISFYVMNESAVSVHSGLVGSILSFEHAIGVRTGCFCAGPLMADLLGFSAEREAEVAAVAADGHVEHVPHAVRASFSFGTTHAEVDRLVGALNKIHHGDHGEYQLDPKHGSWEPVGWDPGLEQYIEFRRAQG